MEREISTSVQIGAALIAMAALLGLVIFTVFIGDEVKGNAIEEAVEVSESVVSGYFEDMKDKNTILPSAAAYALLQKGMNVVMESTCKICGEEGEPGAAGECMVSHLRGKVSLQVEKTTADQYIVTIHRENCTWESGACNCP